MPPYFDQQYWLKALKNPLWYLDLHPEYQKLIEYVNNHPEERGSVKEALYSFIDTALENKQISLAQQGPDLDEERKPIDTIVIHHTKNKSGMTWRRLSAVHLIRLYTGYEGRKEAQETLFKERKPIYSNHFRNGEQVFYSYHWLVREDGDTERLLNDSEIGWHAGNWDINCRSVGICIDNDHENSTPSPVVVSAIRSIIDQHYPTLDKGRIFGHREINPKTTCPGNTFLTEWKIKIVS
jgi:N-acetyl-anhydromuramyl-L-alanine amidase AmpD